MKLLILTLIFSVNLLAQTTNINNETNLNNTLMQNAAQQQINNQQGVQTNRPSMDAAGGVNGNGSTNLTDQEKQLSENYIDQAAANKVIQDSCSGDNERICAGQKVNFKGKQTHMDAKTGEMVAKAYALFSGMGDSTLKTAGPADAATKGADKAGGAAETHPEPDNCKYIPSGTEMLAQFMQQQNSDFMSAASKTQNSDLAQKDALLKAAMSHEERAKNSQIQAYGWLAGFACYGGMGIVGGAVMTDPKYILKLGATFFLYLFYQDEVDAYNDYANQTRAIANSLPGKGACNPITEKICYCGTEAHKTDPQYGQYCNPPGLHNNPIAQGSYRVACTDNNMKLDPACNCTKTNSCFDQALAAKTYGSSLGMGSLAGAPFIPVRSLARGELTSATVSGNINGNALAIGKSAMAKASAALPGNSNSLNANQLEFAKALMAKGMPGPMAHMMAQQNIPAGALNSAMAKFQGAALGTGGSAYAPRSNVMDFSGGAGLGVGGRPGNSGRKNEPLSFAAKKGPSSNVLEFAAKAQAAAQAGGQIRQSDTSLFEVISNRYQLSGRRLLELDAAH